MGVGVSVLVGARYAEALPNPPGTRLVSGATARAPPTPQLKRSLGLAGRPMLAGAA